MQSCSFCCLYTHSHKHSGEIVSLCVCGAIHGRAQVQDIVHNIVDLFVDYSPCASRHICPYVNIAAALFLYVCRSVCLYSLAFERIFSRQS